MFSVFTRIIQGDLPCEKIYETETEICFLDVRPHTEGHTLVVAKREVPRFEELTPEESASLMQTMQKVARAVSRCYGGADYNIQLNNGPKSGQEVPHVHFHIIPRPNGLEAPRLNKYAEGQMEKVGEQIRAQLD
jgi:histidine triad (HIT) family protein